MQAAVLRRFVDDADALDAGDAWIGHLRVRLPFPGGDFGLIDAKRLHLDAHPATLEPRHRHILEHKRLQAAGLADDDRAHRGRRVAVRRRCPAHGQAPCFFQPDKVLAMLLVGFPEPGPSPALL
jgi:hypothetical protein